MEKNHKFKKNKVTLVLRRKGMMFLRSWCWDQHCLTSMWVTWTVELSAPSSSLPMTPSGVVEGGWLEEEDVIQRDLDRLEGWDDAYLIKFNETKCKGTWTTPSTNTGWAEKGLKEALRKPWELTRSSTWPCVCRPIEIQMCFGLHENMCDQQGKGENSLPTSHSGLDLP